MKPVPNPVVSCSNVSLIPFLMRRLNLTHISFSFPYFSFHHLFLVFVQYERTQHNRMQSHRLSSDGILPTSPEVFTVMWELVPQDGGLANWEKLDLYNAICLTLVSLTIRQKCCAVDNPPFLQFCGEIQAANSDACMAAIYHHKKESHPWSLMT